MKKRKALSRTDEKLADVEEGGRVPGRQKGQLVVSLEKNRSQKHINTTSMDVSSHTLAPGVKDLH